MERTSIPPEAMIASLPDGVREDVAALDLLIGSVFEGRERVLWEGVFWGGTDQRIIGYGGYHATNKRGTPVDWFVVGLAAQRDHISLYVNAVRDGEYLVKAYADRLGKVKVGSANVTFRTSAGLDLAAVQRMVQEARDLVPGS